MIIGVDARQAVKRQVRLDVLLRHRLLPQSDGFEGFAGLVYICIWMAVITGLRALPAPARVCIHIDSTYVMNNFEGGLSAGKATAGGRRTGSR